MKIIKCKDYEEMSKRAASYIRAIVTLKPNAVLGLATGSTPISTYKQLIECYNVGKLDFSEIISINLDEYVGLDDKNDQSYRYFMNENLFNHINIKKENTYVPNGIAKDLEAECKRYDDIIEKFGPIDLQLLGLGQNGHIGFNEPDNHFSFETHVVSLTENTIMANKRFFNSIDEVPKKAITMGIYPIINAKNVLMVASGKVKADAVEKIVKGNITPECPASILKYHKNFVLIVDEEAASKI